VRYRKFGRLDWKVSALGFGCMRLPTMDADSANIDESEATRMLHHAIDRGVNYVDTAYPYHGGNSEPFVGRALRGGYREKVKLATKLPIWLVEAPEDFDRYLNEQLGKLQMDHIDFYLFHGLNEKRWKKCQELDLPRSAEKAVSDGRIGHIGFSFHDKYPVFKEIVDGYSQWTLCQIQYNYMGIEVQAGAQGLKYAGAQGLAVVVMGPLLGGRLVNPPERIQEIWNVASSSRTPADWALQWVWSQPEVSVVLSGMSTMEQVEQNVASANASRIGAMTQADLNLIDEVREKYKEVCPIPCTGCEYCLPCPNRLNIPFLLDMVNRAVMYDKFDEERRQYQLISGEERPNLCEKCQKCEEMCPQKIAIADWMDQVYQVFGEGQTYVGLKSLE
jgi:predicted aldo/keto reductase-like oxidoreductase